MANAYLMVLKLTDKKTRKSEEHTLHLEAYTAQEAVYQALLELPAKLEVELSNFDTQIVTLRPDTAKAREETTQIMKDMLDAVRGTKRPAG